MAALVLLIILQITDGLFTFHGVNAVGIDKYESNPILRYYIYRFGPAEALFAAKVGASLLGYVLYKWKQFNALWLLDGFYLSALYQQIIFLIHYNDWS